MEQAHEGLALAEKIGGESFNIEFNLAILEYEQGNYAEALELFKELSISENDDERKDAYYYMAECFYNMEDPENACTFFFKSMTLGDKDAEQVYYNYCQKGQLRKFLKERKKTEKVTF